MITGFETRNNEIRWFLEIYSYESPSVAVNEEKNEITIIAGAQENSPEVDSIINSLKERGVSGGFTKAKGVTNISFQRSKNSPSGTCNISTTGKTPPNAHIGSWVVVSSLRSSGQKFQILTRYIGQIISLDVQYVKSPDGTLNQMTNMVLREWSSILDMPVMYDIFSLQAQTTPLARATELLADKTGTSFDEITDFLKKSFDPYELASTIFVLTALMNKEDGVGIVKSLGGKQAALPKIALTACDVPSNLLNRVKGSFSFGGVSVPKIPGVGGSLGEKKSSYQDGFAKMMIGVQKGRVISSPNWNGVFKKSELDSFSSNLKSGHDAMGLKVSVPGISMVVQSELSAWRALDNFCDNTVNEAFTDIWHVEGSNGNIFSQPVIVFRNKPFLIKSLVNDFKKRYDRTAIISDWTYYDDVPRVNIPDSAIVAFSVNNTFMNSPNYSRMEYRNVLNAQTSNAISAVDGIIRLEDQMKRFGGIANSYETSFMPTKDSADWFKGMRELLHLWHGYSYMMGNGVLNIKDGNLAISVGLNAQFKFGEFTLCGHIESYNVDLSIDPTSGLASTTTSVVLSRIVLVNDSGELELVPPDIWGQLTGKKPQSSLAGNAISEITNAIKDFV